MPKKTTKRKSTARKTTKRTARRTSSTASAKAAAPKKLRITPAAKTRTKSEVYALLADGAGISKKEVAALFDTLCEVIGKDLSKRGPGMFNVPGMMKVLVQRKPATKARMGINPFTGQETMFKAKPARNVIKVRPLKKLKELV